MGWLPVASTALRAFEADVVPMAPIAKLLDETAVVLLQLGRKGGGGISKGRRRGGGALPPSNIGWHIRRPIYRS